MEIGLRKEQFGRAYVRAVASVAGFSVYEPDVDDDSVDLGLASRGAEGTTRAPRLEMQLKSTSVQDVLEDEHLRFPLPVKNYNDLRPENLLVPRILVVALLPAEMEDWLTQNEEQLAMRRCAYWLSLRGREATENEET